MTDQSARSGAEILAEISPTVRTAVAHVCLRPDLVDEWERENAELIRLQTEDAGNKRLGTGVSTETKKQAKKVRGIEERVEAADLALTFRKIDKTRHSEICDENPPRDGNMLDYSVGFNRDAVDNAVAFESLVEPVFERCGRKGCKHADCGTWDALVKLLGPGDWAEVASVVQQVNEAVAPPKSVLASRILDRPDSASARRARGA